MFQGTEEAKLIAGVIELFSRNAVDADENLFHTNLNVRHFS
jgi:hypothetical protein